MADRLRRAGREDTLLVREARAEDASQLAEVLTHEDVAEAVAATGLPARDALLWGYAESFETWTAADAAGQVLAMGGLGQRDNRRRKITQVWLVCAPGAKHHRVELARILQCRVRKYREKHGLLFGYVDARNKVRQRWLELLGFKVGRRPIQLGHLGLPFYRFIA